MYARYVVDETPSPSFRAFWFICQLTAACGLLVVLGIALTSKRVHRMATWYGLCLSWVISAISYSLLALVGQDSGRQPPLNICLTQSSLIYAAPVLTAYAGLAFMIQLWLITTSFVRGAEKLADQLSSGQTLALLVFPYVFYVIVLVADFQYGLVHLDSIKVLGTGVYCVDTTGVPGRISSIFVAIAMICVLCLQALCFREHYLVWRAYGCLRSTRPAFTLLARVLLLSLIALAAIGVTVNFAVQDKGTATYGQVLLALLPVASLILLGMSPDIMRACMFWRHPGKTDLDKPLPSPPTASHGCA